MVHRRETSNALNASVHCEQKRLQRLSETVPINNQIPQAVRQGIPDRRTSHAESPSAIGAELVTRYDKPNVTKAWSKSPFTPSGHETELAYAAVPARSY